VNERELLLAYRPWLRTTARNFLRGRPEHQAEDLAQEGWIAMWRAFQDDSGGAPLDWWLKRQAILRMNQMIRDWLTTNKQRAHLFTDDVGALVELSAHVEGIEIAYHHGEILQALNALTSREREYVYLRFWCGWRQPQMIEHFGYKPSALWGTARPKLRAALAHLAA
jgi:RNA polymerase sigma factor (sigma-70 family)